MREGGSSHVNAVGNIKNVHFIVVGWDDGGMTSSRRGYVG